jgi:hypothetical protein
MKITVELPEAELSEICQITGISKKGPAIRRLLSDSLQTRRRATIAEKFISGEWSAELQDFESAKAADRNQSLSLTEQWRD